MTIDDKDMINSILESVSRIDYIKPEDIKKLQEQRFTIREIEILSKIPKSSVARELKEMSEDE